MKPILKWPGGKTQILPQLRALAPEKFGTYYETFAGGLALFFDLEPERAVLSDRNIHLSSAYAEIENDPKGVAKRLAALVRRGIEEEDYYREVDRWNADERGAARLVYLNRLCYNGLYRESKSGRFHAPFGKWRKFKAYAPTFPTQNDFVATASALRRATIFADDFEDATRFAERGDFVFFDPPYEGRTFDYTADGWTRRDQMRLSACAERLAALGVRVLVTDHDTPANRAFFDPHLFDFVPVAERRTVNSDDRGRGGKKCLIIASKIGVAA